LATKLMPIMSMPAWVASWRLRRSSAVGSS
jgi:hypothetical protein